MADDPLSGWTPDAPQASPDPLAGWTPNASLPDPTPPPSQSKGVWETAIKPEPSPTNVDRIRSAFGEGYQSVPESVTRPGERSFFTPETQKSLAGTWYGPTLNLVGDTAGTALAGVAGVGNSAMTLGNEALKSFGVPDPLIRDINVEVTRRAGEPAGTGPGAMIPRKVADLQREMATPPEPPPAPSGPSLYDLWRKDQSTARAASPPDPVTTNIISMLRPNEAPPPPTQFTTAPGPAPAPATPPTGGLLNMQPPAPVAQGGLLGPGVAPAIMSQADMQSVAKGHYSLADEAKANGMRMTPAEGDAIRKPLVDAIPTDPQDVAHFNDTPLAGEANKVKDFVGQDMSIGTAMQIDRGLSRAIRATTDPTDKANLITAQNGVRDGMEQSPVFQSQPDARQAWSQSIKQGQIEDIETDVATRDENQQEARRRTLVGNLLRNDTALRSWSPDEVAELQQRYDQSKVGSLKQFGINLIKPITTATGAGLGAWMGGPTGGFIGSRIGEQGGDMLAAAARRRAMSIDLTPVSQRLTANMPPPPTGLLGGPSP